MLVACRLAGLFALEGEAQSGVAGPVGAKMTPAQITEAQRMAREWKPTSPALKHETSRRAREALPA